VSLADGVTCEDCTTIRWDTQVGANTSVRLNAFVGSYIEIGDHSRISGMVMNSSKIGRYVTVSGFLTHAYHRYGGGQIVPAPILEDYVNIGRGATVVGSVVVGQYAYVAAGAIVTKDVPPKTLVTGVNQFRSFDEWDGAQDYVMSFPPASAK
jgi:acetyltransferase-like isoleucine patch superfamily enzyme